jgi:hypothetical protein
MTGEEAVMRRVVPLALLALALPACAGPKEPLPKTYAVTGQVRFAGGGPVPGGLVQFRATRDSPYTILGHVKPDGGFTLETRLSDGRKAAGAPEGTYRVTVLPPSGADQGTAVTEFPETYTVKPEDGNVFRFTVPGPAKK